MQTGDELEPPSGLSFGDLLDWHLRRGTRPPGSEKQGEAWKKAAFAEDVGISDKQVRNWIASKSFPHDSITIERILFGRDQNRHVALRMQLRDALKRSRANSEVADPAASPRHWAQAIDYGRLPETFYERLVGREPILKRLDAAWSNPRVNIVSLIAEGGAGKSALVNEWLKRSQAENYHSAEAVLGWSFYDQGTKERTTSSDEFLDWALQKLGIEVSVASVIAKAEAIAEMMMQRRVLLLLDGVEPLQHGLQVQLGELKDPGLRAMLRRFASTPPHAPHGLIVLTSRLAIKDIARWQFDSAPVTNVERLSNEAGAALLHDNGIWGTENELLAAASEFGGHPLALSLLAGFLKQTQSGNVLRRDHIRGLLSDKEIPGHEHAKRVMESFEKQWLNDEPVLLAIMLGSGLIDYSQKMTTAAMQIADMNV
jgi:hypothetical protein